MSMLRLALFSAAAVIALPQISVKAENIDAQFVGGTRNAIPANTIGTLNLDDAKELKFNYGGAVYRVPYAQITGSDIQKSEDGRKLFGHVPLPSLTPWKRKQVLSISFKDSGDKTGSLNFQLWTKDAALAQTMLAERRDPKASTSQTAVSDDSWWGDKYWKTVRNHNTWGSEKPVDASQAPQTAASVSNK
jgi:hypothetical protein